MFEVKTWITKKCVSSDGWSEIKPFLFVCLALEDGLEGWGEAFTLPCRTAGCAQIIHDLCQEMVSQKATTPTSFHALANTIADKHRGMDFSAATSAIEMALWDIQGKIEQKPLRHLLAATPRDQVDLYANIWSDNAPDIDEICIRGKKWVRDGFKAIKYYPLQNRSVAAAATSMSRMRETVGDEVALLLDLASPNDPMLARQLAPLVRPFDPYWFEEPVDGEDTRELAAIRKMSGLRVVTGEKQCGVPHFRETLAAGAADILNPDIAGVGGILDILEISRMADRDGVLVSPHCWNSMSIAAGAMLQVCAAVPNADMAEIYPDFLDHAAIYTKRGHKIVNGRAILNDCPGLGIEINKFELTKLAADARESFLG